ncbi:MAG: ABC transporter substrate-binding protein [Reyranellaceae bacterium]
MCYLHAEFNRNRPAMRSSPLTSSLRRALAALLALAMALAMAMAMLGAGAARAADKVRLGVFIGSVSPPAVLADETGAFAAEGIEIEFVPFGNAALAATAIVSGDIDVAAMALSAAAYNLAGKGGLRVIAGSVREMPGYEYTAYVVTPAAWEAGIRSPRALLERRIGITTVGSPLHFFVAALAEKAGKDPRLLELVQMQSMSASSAGLQSGRIDGAMLVKALALRAEREGFGRIVGWVGDETPGQNGALLAAPATIAGKRELIERFLRAFRAGSRLYFDTFLRRDGAGQPVKGADHDRFLEVLAKRNGAALGLMATSLGYNDPDARLDIDSVLRQIALGRRLGLIDQSFDPSDILERSLLNPERPQH